MQFMKILYILAEEKINRIWKNDTLPYPDLYRDIPGSSGRLGCAM